MTPDPALPSQCEVNKSEHNRPDEIGLAAFFADTFKTLVIQFFPSDMSERV